MDAEIIQYLSFTHFLEGKMSNPALHMCTVYCIASIAYTSRSHGRDRR